MNLEQWKQKGRTEEVDGRRFFVVEQGSGAETIVLLHGYPTSSHDYWRVIDRLSESYRVVVHDHLGFGLSEKPADYSYSLIEQAEYALALWKKLDIKRAHVIAHDYGTSVATEILARRERGWAPVDLQSLTLCNGSVHIELARLRPIQRVMANGVLGPLAALLVNRRFFERQMRALWADPGRLSAEDLEAMWDALMHNEGIARMPQITRYLHERYRYWHRWIGALTRLDIPTHILWACLDPVAVPKIGERLAWEVPNVRATWFEDLGHYPMLEDSQRWATSALDFLGRNRALIAV